MFLGREQNDESKNANVDRIILVHTDGLDRFLEQRILAKVRELWRQRTGRGMEEWEWHSERFFVHPSLAKALSVVDSNQQQEKTEYAQQQKKQKLEKDESRRQLFRQLQDDPGTHLTFMGKLWPSHFTAHLLIQTRMVPGRKARLVQLGFVEHILKGYLKPDENTENLLQYVNKQGITQLFNDGLK